MHESEEELDDATRAWRVIFSKEYVGDLLRSRREAMGWSLSAAVKHTGISRSALQRLESGETSEIEKIQRYASALGYAVHLELVDKYQDTVLPGENRLRVVP